MMTKQVSIIASELCARYLLFICYLYMFYMSSVSLV